MQVADGGELYRMDHCQSCRSIKVAENNERSPLFNLSLIFNSLILLNSELLFLNFQFSFYYMVYLLIAENKKKLGDFSVNIIPNRFRRNTLLIAIYSR